MKRLLTLMLGLSFLTTTVSVVYGQSTTKKAKKPTKKPKPDKTSTASRKGQ